MIKINRWFTKNWVHFVIWLCFIFYETIIVGLIFGEYAHLLTYLGHYLINISFFYFNAHIAFRWALAKRPLAPIRMPLTLAVEGALFILINFALDWSLVNCGIIHDITHFSLNKGYALRIIFRFIYFLSFSTAYYFLTNFLKEVKKSSLLERQQLLEMVRHERITSELSNAQNSILRAQINPHFLFNTLDYIYHKMSSDKEKAGEAILLLSEIMRYAVESTEGDGFITLGNEVEHVEKLLYLYQLRKESKLNIEVSIADEVRDLRFIPLIILTLLENIIKHGNLNREDDPATLSVYIHEQNLFIYTNNLIDKLGRQIGTQKGMKNIESRLKNTFGDQAIFHSSGSDSKHFSVSIIVPLGQISQIQSHNAILFSDN